MQNFEFFIFLGQAFKKITQNYPKFVWLPEKIVNVIQVPTV